MSRLNDRAYALLVAEIDRCVGTDPLRQAQREVVLKRLERLRTQQGSPVGAAQLREAILDLIPNANPDTIAKAARANRSAANLGRIKAGLWLLLGIAGVLYVANLPVALIRRPISQHAPLLLLPSYIGMDYHYKQAIASVEQADQLVNQATSVADLELGAVKVAKANGHLDKLPVWFLEPGYRNQFWWYGHYTIDDFRQAREAIGRMEAKLFQEKNAQTSLTEAEQALATAKQTYQQASEPDQKTVALAQWQAALDKLEQIPTQTLAGKQVEQRLPAHQRDFTQVAGVAQGSARSGNLVQAAQAFALKAAQAAQNPPHAAAKWKEIISLWEEAIDPLETITVDDPGYVNAQQLLATYKNNLSVMRIQLQAEETAVAALEKAEQLTQSLLASASSNDRDRNASQLQAIVTTLQKVEPGTTAYPKAQQLLASAQQRLAALQAN
jgi:hypothetical protein